MTAVYELRAYLGKERCVPRSAMALDSRLRRPPCGSAWSGARPVTWCWKSAAIWRARTIACIGIDTAVTEIGAEQNLPVTRDGKEPPYDNWHASAGRDKSGAALPRPFAGMQPL